MFRIAVHIEGLIDMTGEGRSKRIAEQEAAEAFLKREGLTRENISHV
jgi:ribonuclease III